MVRPQVAVSLFLLSLFSGIGWSQTNPNAGILPFSTQAGGPFDSIDLATSSITFMLPVRSKVGKIPFSFKFVFNSGAYMERSAWGTVPGFQLQAFAADLGASVSYTSAPSTGCPSSSGEDLVYTYSAVVDPTGAFHPLSGSGKLQFDTNGCYAAASNTTSDGSGYTVSGHSGSSCCYITVYDSAGNAVSSTNGEQLNVGNDIVTDPDDVTMTYSTDTLNEPTLNRNK